MAVAGVAGEALALFGLGSWLAYGSLTLTPANTDIAQGSTAYFLTVGVVVAALAHFLHRRRGWAAGPAVLVQLIGVLMALTMLREGFLLGGLPTLAVTVVTLAALVSPKGREALGR